MSRTGKPGRPGYVQDSQTVSHLGKALQTKVPAHGDIQTNQMTTSHLGKPLGTGSSQTSGGSSGQGGGKK